MLFSCDVQRDRKFLKCCAHILYFKFTKGVAFYIIFIVCKADCSPEQLKLKGALSVKTRQKNIICYTCVNETFTIQHNKKGVILNV